MLMVSTSRYHITMAKIFVIRTRRISPTTTTYLTAFARLRLRTSEVDPILNLVLLSFLPSRHSMILLHIILPTMHLLVPINIHFPHCLLSLERIPILTAL